jgi:UDP-glucose 4-epimerase
MPRRHSKILVTGGAGFIGSHIVDRLLTNDFEVTVIDDLSTGRLENIASHQTRKDFHFIQGDIQNLDLVSKTLQDVDAIFHEAALVGVTDSVENPILTNDVNVTGTLNLLKTCLDSNVKRFIYASSAAVYGKTETLPLRESLVPQPISPYGVSKLAAENYAKVFYEVYGLETVCLRYFNVYGPRQTYRSYSGVITIFINQLLNGQPPIIHGDGKQTRDFINIQDVVEASMLALARKNAVGEVLNIGRGIAVSMNEVASMLQKITGKTELESIHTNPRTGDIRNSYADITKARKVLGYSPNVDLKDGLTQLVEWYRSEHISKRA